MNDIFAIVPLEAVKDKRMTLETLRVLITLLSFRAKNTDLVWPKRSQMAERCGMHESNISKATRRLVELGWLEKPGSAVVRGPVCIGWSCRILRRYRRLKIRKP
ncbi:helix-turn-helix domain-containing protein [Methylomonas sp. CM2]|uniref:helix-turn-helix domain-containing protein n=1 Tax=Methylomonas sp. CM2 TaxID=3417647 RepID=UPI003CE9EEC7